MKIQEIVDSLSLKVLCSQDYLNEEITSGYSCDLLSWVMAHGTANGIWITIQTHMNVVAVASLLDISCILIPEDIEVDETVLKKAEEEGIVVLSSSATGYELAGRLFVMGIGPCSR